MRNNNLGPVDKTVSVLIDRSYPVVKEVYLHLEDIKNVYEHVDSIQYVSEHLDEIQNLQVAADHLNRIQESIDNLDEIKEHLDHLHVIYENLGTLEDIFSKVEVFETANKNFEITRTVVDNIQDINNISGSIVAVQTVAREANINAVKKVSENIEAVGIVSSISEDVSIVSINKDAITSVSKNITPINQVSSGLQNINTIAGDLIGEYVDDGTIDYGSITDEIDSGTVIVTGGNIKTVAENMDAIKEILSSLNSIKDAPHYATVTEEAAERASAFAEEANSYLVQTQEVANEVALEKDRVTAEANAQVARLITEASSLSESIESLAQSKKDELDLIAGTYFVPSVSEDGTLSQTNTGSLDNPVDVNIKGPKGDTGHGFILKGQLADYNELISLYPSGSEGDAQQLLDTRDVYLWDINKLEWVNVGPLKGADGLSANEVLMDPDPVEYFKEIYGETDLATGDIIVDVSGNNPSPAENFESMLEGN